MGVMVGAVVTMGSGDVGGSIGDDLDNFASLGATSPSSISAWAADVDESRSTSNEGEDTEFVGWAGVDGFETEGSTEGIGDLERLLSEASHTASAWLLHETMRRTRLRHGLTLDGGDGMAEPKGTRVIVGGFDGISHGTRHNDDADRACGSKTRGGQDERSGVEFHALFALGSKL